MRYSVYDILDVLSPEQVKRIAWEAVIEAQIDPSTCLAHTVREVIGSSLFDDLAGKREEATNA